MNRLLLAAMVALSGALTGCADDTRTRVSYDICRSDVHYKLSCPRPFYTTCHYRYDNLTELAGHDLGAYRRALASFLGVSPSMSPAAVMDSWGATFTTETAPGFERTAEVGRSVRYDQWYNTHGECEDDIYPYGAPQRDAQLLFCGYHVGANVVWMQLDTFVDTGGGMGASMARDSKPFYFDFDTNRQLELTDLVGAGGKRALLQGLHEWLSEHEDNLCLNEMATDVQLSDIWRIAQESIVFVYPKYTIACGAGGVIEVPVYTWQLEGKLTDKGKMLLGTPGVW